MDTEDGSVIVADRHWIRYCFGHLLSYVTSGKSVYLSEPQTPQVESQDGARTVLREGDVKMK